MPAEGHYPYQVGIDAYGNGGFRFAGMSHRGSLLCLPTGMHAWDVHSPAELTLESLGLVLDAADRIDVLLIGLGKRRTVTAVDLAQLREAARKLELAHAEAKAGP